MLIIFRCEGFFLLLIGKEEGGVVCMRGFEQRVLVFGSSRLMHYRHPGS